MKNIKRPISFFKYIILALTFLFSFYLPLYNGTTCLQATNNPDFYFHWRPILVNVGFFFFPVLITLKTAEINFYVIQLKINFITKLKLFSNEYILQFKMIFDWDVAMWITLPSFISFIVCRTCISVNGIWLQAEVKFIHCWNSTSLVAKLKMNSDPKDTSMKKLENITTKQEQKNFNSTRKFWSD